MLLDFLQQRKNKRWLKIGRIFRLCGSCARPSRKPLNLGLELHDLELLRELAELLVDVHHSHRGVGHLAGLGVDFLFKEAQAKWLENE